MKKQLIKTIQGLGFDEKEATVYLACLEAGNEGNNKIAKLSNLNRVTNYEILKRLEKKGVVASYKKRNIKYFVAIDPKVLIEQVRSRLKMAEEVLPQMSALLNNLENKPKIYFFEEEEGIKNIYNDSLQTKTEILTFTNPKELIGSLGKYHDIYVEERRKKGIVVKGLAANDSLGLKAKKDGIGLKREVRLFDKTRYCIHNEIMIYDNKVTIYSSKDKMGVVIENEKICDSFRNIWQMVWESNKA